MREFEKKFPQEVKYLVDLRAKVTGNGLGTANGLGTGTIYLTDLDVNNLTQNDSTDINVQKQSVVSEMKTEQINRQKQVTCIHFFLID